MKKTVLILIVLILTSFPVFSQSVGDYRSLSSGNWNDPTKWETYNGSSWVASNTYPGQNPGSGAVIIMVFHEIKLTAAVLNPIASLLIDQLTDYSDNGGTLYYVGVLTFSSASPVSLTVSGSVTIHGDLRVENQNGAKAHTLSIRGGFEVGTKVYGDCFTYEFTAATFQTINQDDKLTVVFTGNGWIDSGPSGIEFQDITFNGGGFTVITPVFIRGTASFINGIVTTVSAPSIHNADCQIYYTYNGAIFFSDNATVSGASNASHVDGTVSKEGDDPFIFPIGSGNVYAPLTISAPTSTEESVSAEYRRSNASDLGPISDPGLFNVSNCEYWWLDLSHLNNSINVTAGWSTVSGCGSSPYVSNSSDVTLAHFNFSTWRWDSHGGSGVGTTINGSVTWSNLSTSGTFTLGNLNVCDAPWATATNISPNSATLSWPAIGGGLSYDVDYKPYTSNEWINAATATSSTSVDFTGLNPWMSYDWRIRTNCSSSSSSYRQGSFQTLCGPPTGLMTTNITENSATLSWSVFANWVSYNLEYKQSTSATWITAATYLTDPSFTLSGLTAGVTYDWRVVVNCRVDNQGGYTESSFTTPGCVDNYEPNNTSGQAKAITLGNTISAVISSTTDVDWFSITVPGSTNIVLSVFLSNPPADFDLYVYNKNLTLVGSSTTSGNEVVTFDVRGKNTVYYIKVVGKNGAYKSSQCYNLLAYQFSNNTKPVARSIEPANETASNLRDHLLYPNPASDFVSLRFNSSVAVLTNVQILNSIGQLVKLNSIKINEGYNQVQIPLTDIRPGMYLLRINKDGVNITTKFVIER